MRVYTENRASKHGGTAKSKKEKKKKRWTEKEGALTTSLKTTDNITL